MPRQNLKDNNQQAKCKRMNLIRSWFYTANESGKTTNSAKRALE